MISPWIFILWIALISVLLGRTLLSRLRISGDSFLETTGFGTAFGLGLVGYGIYILGLRGGLQSGKLLGLLILLTVVGLPCLPGFFRGLFLKIRLFVSSHSVLEWIVPVLLCSGALLALFFASIPPTAHDALAYQLYLPKRFAQAGDLVYLPSLVNSLFPFLIQMFYTAGLVLSQPEAAGMIHCLTGLITILGVIALGRRLLGDKSGWTAGLILLLTPGVFIQMVIPYNDVALMCFSFYAFFGCLKALEADKASLRRKWMLIAGVLAGFAMSIKYLALLSIGTIGLTYGILAFMRRDIRARLCDLLFFCAAAAVCSFAWYLRSWMIEGNPVYPFFSGLFGSDVGHAYDFAKQGFGKGIIDLVLAPVRMTLIPEKFGGTWARIGMVYLIFIPIGIHALKDNKSLRPVAILSGIFFLAWFFLIQNTRFLLPILPLWAVLAASGAAKYRRCLAIVLLIHGLAFVYHGSDSARFLVGLESRDAYLSRTERTYEMSRWVNTHIDRDARILNLGDIRMFYFDPPMVREKELRKRSGYENEMKSAGEVIHFLRQQEIDFIFYDESSSGKRSHPALSIPGLMDDPAFRGQYLERLHSAVAAEDRKYVIYRILDGTVGIEED